jgi:hypothetical protein
LLSNITLKVTARYSSDRIPGNWWRGFRAFLLGTEVDPTDLQLRQLRRSDHRTPLSGYASG